MLVCGEKDFHGGVKVETLKMKLFSYPPLELLLLNVSLHSGVTPLLPFKLVACS